MMRIDMQNILNTPRLRRTMMVRAIQAVQNREGIPTTFDQAARAYDLVQSERKGQ